MTDDIRATVTEVLKFTCEGYNARYVGMPDVEKAKEIHRVQCPHPLEKWKE